MPPVMTREETEEYNRLCAAVEDARRKYLAAGAALSSLTTSDQMSAYTAAKQRLVAEKARKSAFMVKATSRA